MAPSLRGLAKISDFGLGECRSLTETPSVTTYGGSSSLKAEAKAVRRFSCQSVGRG